MPITIGSNIGSLKGVRQLGRTTDELASVNERLASGQRINRASDDAAGLAIASSLTANSRIATQAIRNINDGFSATSIAAGALESLSAITTRQLELAQQAATGTYSKKQRSALDKEAAALSLEFNRIVESTSFNDLKLLETRRDITLQVGTGVQGTLTLQSAAELQRLIGSGSFAESISVAGGMAGFTSVVAGDLDSDGNHDLAFARRDGAIYFAYGSGNGTFTAVTSIAVTGNRETLALGDINGDGRLDIVSTSTSGVGGVVAATNTGSRTWSTTTYADASDTRGVTILDANGDGYDDIAYTNASNFHEFSIRLGSASGTLSNRQTFTSQYTGGSQGNPDQNIATGDFNNDGRVDVFTLTQSQAEYSLQLGNGDGTFRTSSFSNEFTGEDGYSFRAADFDLDGNLDVIAATNAAIRLLRGNGDGTFKSPAQVSSIVPSGGLELADVNSDGYQDAVVFQLNGGALYTLFNQKDGTFSGPITSTLSATSNNFSIAASDFNGDGVSDLAVASFGSGGIRIALSNTVGSSLTTRHDLTTVSGARTAVGFLTNQLERINREASNLGAFESRAQTASNVLSVMREQFEAARSRIADADIADEAARRVRLSIAQNAATAVLAQANIQPSLALTLLKPG